MEIIEVTGYTIEEKLEIARRHLLPKQLKENGITEKHLTVSDRLLERVIEDYTNESGVRGLERKVGRLARYRAKQVAMDEPFETEILESQLHEILGAAAERDRYLSNDIPGVVTGLAWTPVGGDVLYIESSLNAGKGRLTLTGNLGDVMKESATIALEYLKGHAKDYKIDPEAFDKHNVHVHVPEGATPKDGPSAGVTMLTALASLFTGRKVKAKIAMTGEITLRGKVLPVGGIKEKILAARRAGVTTVLLSKMNQKDVDEIKPEFLKGLKFHYVDQMKEVLDFALLK
jgi:ATP-dependent Lon protease